MNQPIQGIHHITAIAGDAQQNLDFYTEVLGLRLVKLTVNFDDPGTYHFYFGDETGTPGTILTFFPYPDGRKGRHGTGQADGIAFAAPEGSLDYWAERLTGFDAEAETPAERFGQRVLSFADPDGLRLELVETASPTVKAWEGGPVPAEYAIRGFFGITLAERDYEKTEALLTGTLGLKPAGEEGNRHRFAADADAPGAVVDVLAQPNEPRGVVAVGTVHHVAWRTPDDASQLDWRETLSGLRLEVTPVMDRIYFHSIYFREPGGVLFEIATDAPGFGVDETSDALGSALRLPPWLEPQRAEIEQAVPPIDLPVKAGRGVA